jgi:hypothetical protein
LDRIREGIRGDRVVPGGELAERQSTRKSFERGRLLRKGALQKIIERSGAVERVFVGIGKTFLDGIEASITRKD